jgi:hypothetical protein
MGGLIQQTPLTEQDDSNWRPILLGVGLVIVVVGIVAVLLRSGPKPVGGPHPYAANLKLSDPKMSTSQNFVGALVTYLDGTVTNTGDKTVTHATVEVVFRDSLGQLAQRENIPLQVLQTSGPYPQAVDLRVWPLAPSQSKPFRLTFEHVTTDWNQEMPTVQVMDIVVQ